MASGCFCREAKETPPSVSMDGDKDACVSRRAKRLSTKGKRGSHSRYGDDGPSQQTVVRHQCILLFSIGVFLSSRSEAISEQFADILSMVSSVSAAWCGLGVSRGGVDALLRGYDGHGQVKWFGWGSEFRGWVCCL